MLCKPPRASSGLRRAAATISILGAATAPAAAQTLIEPPAQTCTTINCGATAVRGQTWQIAGLGFGSGHPWTAQVFGAAGKCLRFDVTSQIGADLAMTVVAPDGQTFTNNDGGSGGCSTCPRVVVGQIPATGWYTVNVAEKAAALGNNRFIIRLGQYAADVGNPNCASPTPGQ